jgi:hypothetical protein
MVSVEMELTRVMRVQVEELVQAMVAVEVIIITLAVSQAVEDLVYLSSVFQHHK